MTKKPAREYSLQRAYTARYNMYIYIYVFIHIILYIIYIYSYTGIYIILYIYTHYILSDTDVRWCTGCRAEANCDAPSTKEKDLHANVGPSPGK